MRLGNSPLPAGLRRFAACGRVPMTRGPILASVEIEQRVLFLND
jgi:hypothetical protein